MRFIQTFVLALLVLFNTGIYAGTFSSPVQMLKTVSTKAVNRLKQEKAKLRKGQEVPLKTVHNIINKILLPHVALNRMSRSVLGRHTWSIASAAQKKEFKEQFKDLVINTYASALTTFDKNRIKFYPIRGGYKGKSIVQVNSTINAPGAPPLPVVYHLEKKKNNWLVYDLSVDGISLIQSYRAQFSVQVRQNGLSALIKTLAAHNTILIEQHKR